MSLTAEECKARIKRLLYLKDYAGVIEEVVNIWHADIVAAKWNGEVNEFEIKVSLADLRGEIRAIKRALADNIYKEVQSQHSLWTYNEVSVEEKVSTTKLEKHYHYLVRDRKKSTIFTSGTDAESAFVPYKFYFAVPSVLVDDAKKLLEGVPNYGILDIETGEFAKSARKLERANVRFADIFNMFTRSGTELRLAEATVEYYSNLHEKGEHIHVKRRHVWQDFRGNDHVDWV